MGSGLSLNNTSKELAATNGVMKSVAHLAEWIKSPLEARKT
jgi:hypothetical protein